MKFTQTPKITVAIRKRPLNKKELQRQETDIIRVGNYGQVTVCEYKQKVDLTKYIEETAFNFNYAYDQNSTNEQIYQESIHPLIINAFKGAKVSCFAYGQTGSGKTFTMKGDRNKGIPGLYYLGAQQIFRLIEEPQFANFHICVSFYEIYCGKLFDLLSNRKQLRMMEDSKQNINIVGLEEKYICGAEQFLEVIEEGSVHRVTSQNATNADSSRSHAILQISIKQEKKVYSKISFIDLAGSERGADHMDQNKQTRVDGAEINKSLLSLKQCIRALDQTKSHTPFRGSKLTMVLKDSFVGFCYTVMICNVSPNISASQNTMNTLRYADRVKELKKPEGERLTKEEMLARQLMLPRANKNTIKVDIDRNDDEQDILLKMDEARRKKYDEQKMDIEEPTQINTFDFRKSEQIHKDFKPVSNLNEKKNPNDCKKAGKLMNSVDLASHFKGRDILLEENKQPLISRNVLNMENQNTSNFAPNFIVDSKNKFGKPLTQNINSLHKSHFDAMNNMRDRFVHFRESHEELVGSEMELMREETYMKEEYRRYTHSESNEREIEDINIYLQQMNDFINERMKIYHQMKSNLQAMKGNVRTAENSNKRMKEVYEQKNQVFNKLNENTQIVSHHQISGNNYKIQPKYNLHSSMTNININNYANYNSFADEQLLEGLSSGSDQRLFE